MPNVTASASTGGNISPSGTMTVSSGESITFKMTPSAGYLFKQLAINGSAVQTTIEDSDITDGIALMHFDSEIVDELGKVTITNNGATLSTDISKFGGSSLYFNQNSYLSIAIGSNTPQTIEFWFYPQGSNTSGWYPTLFSTNTTSSAGGTYMHVDDGSYSTLPVCRCNSSSSNTNNGSYGKAVITRDTWHHFAYCTSSSSHYFFVDGVLQATVTQSNPNTITTLYIGGLRGTSAMTSGCYYKGYIDELLISSTCKWTSDFTAPTEVYVGSGGIMYTLSNITEDTTAYALFGVDTSVPISVSSSSNYGTYYGSIENLTDGDTSTYWWTNAAQSQSQYVRFDFSRPVTFNGLIAQTLTNTGDCISSGTVLQVTTDNGTNWVTVGQFTGNATCSFSDLNQTNVNAIRIYVETASSQWLCVNEITLDYEEPISSSPVLYLKTNRAYSIYSMVYKKVSGAWELQSDLESIFNTSTNYVKGN